MEYHVRTCVKGGVKGINIMIINMYIILFLLQGTVYCFDQSYASTRILNQAHNNSNNNQCNNSNNTVDVLMMYTKLNMMFGLYYVTSSVSLRNVRLPNVHTMAIVEMIALSLLKLFDKCSKRMPVIKLLIMMELDLSINTQKLGVRNIEY